MTSVGNRRPKSQESSCHLSYVYILKIRLPRSSHSPSLHYFISLVYFRAGTSLGKLSGGAGLAGLFLESARGKVPSPCPRDY